MNAQDVSLSVGARQACRAQGIDEIEVRRLRASREESSFPGNMYLVVMVATEDGKLLRLSCRHDMPTHVVAVRHVGSAQTSGPTSPRSPRSRPR